MSPWEKLNELTFMGMPSDTGMLQKFFPTISGGEFPYDEEGMSMENEPMDTVDIHGWGHNAPTPSDPRHTAWADKHDGDGQYLRTANDEAEEFSEALVYEVEGSPFLIGKDSGTTGKNQADPKYGNNPFDKEMDDDELEAAGSEDVAEEFENPVDDEELDDFQKDMESEHDPVKYPGTEIPSDILDMAMGGAFTMGLGKSMKSRGDLAGIKDSVGELTPKSAWAYLEAIVVREFSQKK